jgi:SAM-dependent methyltransferase
VREACPFCGSAAGRDGPGRGGAAYRICRRCGSGFVAEPAIAFRDHYERYDPELVRDVPEVVRRRYGDVLAGLEARARGGRRLLEVGCGNGHFLSAARARGWEVRGVELSRPHVERARALGLDVRYGDLADDDLWRGEAYDAVVLIEVIEHVPEPRRLLRAIAHRLVPGGVTYLTTPNFGSVTRRLLGGGWSVLDPEHVSLASAAGLRVALEAAGLRVARLRSKNLYVGEYRRAWRGGRGGAPRGSRAEETARLRDRIEESTLLRTAKAVANAALGATGLGESLECLAVREGAAS